MKNNAYKIVVRVEYDNGVGFFRHRDEHGYVSLKKLNCCEKITTKHDSFLSPFEETFCDNFTQKHKCAYKSIEQMEEWILPHEMEEIVSSGAKVYLLAGTDILFGRDQACYLESNIVERVDITKYY